MEEELVSVTGKEFQDCYSPTEPLGIILVLQK